MILEYLERMREKPHAVRRRFAFICALCVTFVITAVWSLSLPSQFAALSLSGVSFPEEAGINTLGDSISEKNTDLKESIATPQEMEEAFSVFSREGAYGENTLGTSTVSATGSEKIILETTPLPSVWIATTSFERRD